MAQDNNEEELNKFSDRTDTDYDSEEEAGDDDEEE